MRSGPLEPGLWARTRARLTATRRFFSHDVWEQRLDDLPPGVAFRYRSARILYGTFRGLVFEESLHVRAAALTYFTVLSLVPLLAFAFAVLKGFGAYEALVEGTLRPYGLRLLAGNEPLSQAFEKLLEFVGQTGVTSLGFLGLLALLYAATRLLRNIEAALNEIWGASSARDWLQQLRDYVAIIVVTPLSLMAAVALTALSRVRAIVQAAGETLGISDFMDRVLSIATPLAVLFLGLLFLYVVLPNARVRLRSAAVGAVIGSISWYLVLIAHVTFQLGVARFNALYSGFAAFPIFLAWQHVSWLVVLVGAQVASIHQHHKSLAKRKRLARADQALRETICLSATLTIARAFLRGEPPLAREDLSLQLDTPEELIRDLLDHLVASHLLLETTAPKVGYALAKPPEAIQVKDVLDALRRSPGLGPEARRESARVDALAARVLRELDQSLAESPANRHLLELVIAADREAAARARTESSDGEAAKAAAASSPREALPH